jgi:hypothetical protein
MRTSKGIRMDSLYGVYIYARQRKILSCWEPFCLISRWILLISNCAIMEHRTSPYSALTSCKHGRTKTCCEVWTGEVLNLFTSTVRSIWIRIDDAVVNEQFFFSLLVLSIFFYWFHLHTVKLMVVD